MAAVLGLGDVRCKVLRGVLPVARGVVNERAGAVIGHELELQVGLQRVRHVDRREGFVEPPLRQERAAQRRQVVEAIRDGVSRAPALREYCIELAIRGHRDGVLTHLRGSMGQRQERHLERRAGLAEGGAHAFDARTMRFDGLRGGLERRQERRELGWALERLMQDACGERPTLGCGYERCRHEHRLALRVRALMGPCKCRGEHGHVARSGARSLGLAQTIGKQLRPRRELVIAGRSVRLAGNAGPRLGGARNPRQIGVVGVRELEATRRSAAKRASPVALRAAAAAKRSAHTISPIDAARAMSSVVEDITPVQHG